MKDGLEREGGIQYHLGRKKQYRLRDKLTKGEIDRLDRGYSNQFRA